MPPQPDESIQRRKKLTRTELRSRSEGEVTVIQFNADEFRDTAALCGGGGIADAKERIEHGEFCVAAMNLMQRSASSTGNVAGCGR